MYGYKTLPRLSEALSAVKLLVTLILPKYDDPDQPEPYADKVLNGLPVVYAVQAQSSNIRQRFVCSFFFVEMYRL